VTDALGKLIAFYAVARAVRNQRLHAAAWRFLDEYVQPGGIVGVP
jgi:hypothetical protein